ncbi:alginate O-acetyltransferase AlgX-related protein [Amycolatopsis sp. cmx-4-61]|uniref:alginate O-acetyltransferase AlgX-related protein n=1 Tax=Amycolatopsis sp. cmx-4-61 TaxID=2790937 RepID=UPI00397E2C27
MPSRLRPQSPADAKLPQTPESWLPKEHNLYRPRHSSRQRTALTCAIVFFLAPVLLWVAGVQPTAFENRPLRPFPSLGDGWNFFPELTGWATDHLPLRQAGVQAADQIGTGVFGDPPGSGQGTNHGTVGVDQGQSGTGDVPGYVYPQVIPGKDGWLYLGEDVNAKCRPVMDLDHVVSALRRLRAAVESSGRKFVLVFAPDKYTQEPSHLPDDYVGKTCAQARTTGFWSRVPRETGGLDLRPALADAQQRLGRPLYDPNDTHWSYDGGLVMTYALGQAIAPGSTVNWRAAPNGVRPWPADLARLLGRSEQRSLPTYSLSTDGGQDRARYIASDFRSPLRLTQPDGARPAGSLRPNIGIVADSFTQFATPFLAATCQDVTIVHSDTVGQSNVDQLAELFADRDVVTFEFVERSVTGGSSALLRDQTIDELAKALARHPR